MQASGWSQGHAGDTCGPSAIKQRARGLKKVMRDLFDDDHPHEECGVFGIFGDPEAAEKTYLGLYALQHRGQESAGIASTTGNDITLRKGLGLVWSVFSDPRSMPPLKGSLSKLITPPCLP